MSKEQTNYRVVRELLSFATGTEGDLDALSIEQVNERLQSQGIDPHSLAQATQRRLKMLRNEIAAKQAMDQANVKAALDQAEITINGLAFAARAEGTLSEEDRAMIARYAQPDVVEDGNED